MESMEGHVYRGGKYQILNGVFGDRKINRSVDGQGEKDSLLKGFIHFHNGLVDKDILARLSRADWVAINEALNQIHWRSLRVGVNMDVAKKGGVGNKTSEPKKILLTSSGRFEHRFKKRHIMECCQS